MDGPGKGGTGSTGTPAKETSNKKVENSPPSISNIDHTNIQPTNDPVRNKCREMIQTSLSVDVGKYSSQMISLMAARVEG
jgi:hypothetical protein